MRELTFIVQISLDGYVAGIKGEFDNFIGGEENLGFVCDITEEADAILSGRISYQLLNKDWPSAAQKPGATKNMIRYSNWYNTVSKYVLSKTLTSPGDMNTRFIAENIEEEIRYIKQLPGKSILVFGSPTAACSLFELKLVDSIWLIVHPVIFGQGIPFFRQVNQVTKTDLVATRQLSDGTLGLKYSFK